LIFGVALLLALVIGACSGGDGDGGQAAQAELDPTPPAADIDGDIDAEPYTVPEGGAAGQDGDQGSADADAPVDAEEPPAEVDEPEDADADQDAEADEPAPDADTEEEPAETRDRTDLLLQPSEFAQTSPAVDVEGIPPRPDDFADFGRVALPWLQTRTSVEAIVPLFVAWGMPPVSGGFRLNLVDTDGDALLPNDGRSTVVIIYTDPPGDRATGYSNLVVYGPLPEAPGRFRIVYDHDQVEQSFGAEFGRTGIVVTSVADVNADGLRDISFEELICDGTGCTRLRYVLSNTGDGFQRVLH
jgi:hypothetical protein